MEKKIIIVGAGKIVSAQMKTLLEKENINESEVLFVENPSDLRLLANELLSMNTREVRQLVELDKIESTHCMSKNDYNDIQKQNSQQGWKNRPKHKR